MPGFFHFSDSTLTGNQTQVPGIFTDHLLPARVANEGIGIKRPSNYDGFFFLILFLAFVLFALVKIFSHRKLQQLFLAFIKPSAMNQLLRENMPSRIVVPFCCSCFPGLFCRFLSSSLLPTSTRHPLFWRVLNFTV